MKTPLVALAACALLLAAPARAADTANAAVSPLMQKIGGIVSEPMEGKPGVLILNSQKDATAAKVASVAGALQQMLRIPFKVTAAETPAKGWLDAAATMASEKDMVGVVVLCDSEALPSLLVAPESKWAIVNTAALKVDKPSAAVLEGRIAKELWRASAYVLGAANSEFPVCLMKPVLKPADLDALKASEFSLEPMAGIRQQFKALNIVPARRTSYRKACEEGWAPTPTNDIQQAIWDEVKAKK